MADFNAGFASAPIRVVGTDVVAVGCSVLIDEKGLLLFAGPITAYAGDFPPGSVWFLHPQNRKELEEYYNARFGNAPRTLQ